MTGFKLSHPYGVKEFIKVQSGDRVTLTVEHLYAQTINYANGFFANTDIDESGYDAGFPTNTLNWQGTVQAFDLTRMPAANSIEKFPFAITSGSATSTGGAVNNPTGKEYYSTASSQDFGYLAGGANLNPSSPGTPAPLTNSTHLPFGTYGPFFIDLIEKFPFSISSGTATDVGETGDNGRGSAVGAQNDSKGYIIGGNTPNPSNATDQIKSYPFAISSGGTTDTGEYLGVIASATSHGSLSEIFIASGVYSTSATNETSGQETTIGKFPYALPSNPATNVGSLNDPHLWGGSISDTLTSVGILYGGLGYLYPITVVQTIEKFPFAISSGTASDVGETSNNANKNAAGYSSTTHGFTAGGGPHNPAFTSAAVDAIQKFPFGITSGTASDVGELINSQWRKHSYGVRD